MSTVQLEVCAIIFRQDSYPRIEPNPTIVQQYATDLEVLPIEVNQRYELIDGWHRWTAHKKAGATAIAAIITNTTSVGEVSLAWVVATRLCGALRSKGCPASRRK